MQDDFIASLTYEVKQEVVERYFHERRLIELQIDYVKDLLGEARARKEELLVSFERFYRLLDDNHHIKRFAELTGIKEDAFRKKKYIEARYTLPLSSKIRNPTSLGRFKKLLEQEYQRLRDVSEGYGSAYNELKKECAAVNRNISEFQETHDVMIIINFLKSMDTELIMKKHFLGDNFSADELDSVARGLAFKKIRFEQYHLLKPPDMPDKKTLHRPIAKLAGSIYAAHADKVREIAKRL